MSVLQADLLKDLLDDLSDSEATPPSETSSVQTAVAAAADALTGSEGTAEPQAEHGPPAEGATASAPANAPAADGQLSNSAGEGVLSLPDDVLLSVLRRCARADWLSLACACQALRVAAAQDGLWLSEPELLQPASSTACSSQRPVNPSSNSQHGRAASASVGAASSTGQSGTAPGVQLSKRGRANADSGDERPTQRPASGLSRPAGDKKPPAALPGTDEEVEQEPGVGSGGTYLGMAGSRGGVESCETAAVGQRRRDPCGEGGNTRAQPNGTRLYYQRGAARGQQRSLHAALQRSFLATAWLSNLSASVRMEPDQTALPLSVVAGAGGSPCLRHAAAAGALSLPNAKRLRQCLCPAHADWPARARVQVAHALSLQNPVKTPVATQASVTPHPARPLPSGTRWRRRTAERGCW